MNRLVLSIIILSVIFCFGCSQNNKSIYGGYETGFDRDTVYLQFIKMEDIGCGVYPSHIKRTEDKIYATVYIVFFGDDVKNNYIGMRQGNVQNSDSFFYQPYATGKLSHASWTVEMSRSKTLFKINEIIEYDADSNIIAIADVSQDHYKDISTLFFVDTLWRMCHTRVKIYSDNKFTNMYLDELTAIQDSLDVVGFELIENFVVDY